ncbi:MAG: 5-formyltetrahydrofolate cyclo-ligase [Alphaproteobacteria bacterium]
MTVASLDQEKRALRIVARERRRAAHAAAGPGAASAAVANFFAAITPRDGCAVSGYWPMADEFDVRPLMTALHDRGHVCALPVVTGRGRPLVFRRWTPGMALDPAAFGTSVPPADAPEITPELLLVPLLAFDERGYRLGYGGGFYDRTLAGLRAAGRPALAVGVGFEGQRVDETPAAATDQRLDRLITERRARAFA